MKLKKLDTERDRLSDLPDNLLCHILAFLPIAETVRTCVLSRRWKKLYTLVSTLNLDDRDYHGKGFMNTVDRVLFARKGIDVDKLVLTYGAAVDPSRAGGWVQYALWHNVRELDLDLYTVPAELFTCKTLVSLKLSMDEGQVNVLKIPYKISLPSLKILCITSAIFWNEDSVERLFSRCSALEELVLHCCFFDDMKRFNISNSTLKRLTISMDGYYYDYSSEVLINAPSLVYLKLDHIMTTNYLLIDLHSLVEAYIDFGYASNTTDLIKGIRHVESLHLSGALLPRHSPIPTLENMTNLKIGKFYPKGWERVLNFAPCLETLVFEEILSIKENITNPSKEVPPCLISRMKTIKFLLFRGKKSEMQMVEYFLKHGQVLESLIIHMNARKDLQLKITEKLLKFPIASQKCKVVIV